MKFLCKCVAVTAGLPFAVLFIQLCGHQGVWVSISKVAIVMAIMLSAQNLPELFREIFC